MERRRDARRPTPRPPRAAPAADAVRRASSPLRRGPRKGRVRGALALLGPAFVAAVAYIDPGNFATNIAGGAKYGYLLAVGDRRREPDGDARAVPVGQDRHRHGPQPARAVPRRTSPRPVTWGLWVQAEAIAIATDLAEFVGAAIALNLLFGVPPFAAGLMTAVVAFAILALQTRGYRRFELAIAGFLGIVCLGFLYDLAAGRRRRAASSPPASCPRFDGTDSVLLAVGILGATVMPHVVYLHSALTAAPDQAPRTTPSGASCCASSAST